LLFQLNLYNKVCTWIDS